MLQVRGVCSYGKLNYWLGARAAEEGRPSIYPDIDFCKNPGAICSDKRSHELRWATGMFHWVQTVQRSRDYDYFPTLKAFVDAGDYNDGVFIGMVNTMLGGKGDDISRRTKTFFNALKAFNLIEVETNNSTGTPVHTYCGIDFHDAKSKCTACTTNMDCNGMELCYANVKACLDGTNATNAAINIAPGNNSSAATDITLDTGTTGAAASDSPIAMAMVTASTFNYCGKSWGDAAGDCAQACECNHSPNNLFGFPFRNISPQFF